MGKTSGRKTVDYLKLPFGHKVGTEQGAGQQARADDQVLRLVEEGQRCLGLPLGDLRRGGGGVNTQVSNNVSL